MSHSAPPEDQQRLREFLLGLDVPDNDTPGDTALEDRLFAEEEFFDLLQEEQSALIEDAMHGDLSRREARRFTQQQNRSAGLRSAVLDFRALHTALQRRQRPAASPRHIVAPRPRLLWGAAALACLVFAFVAIHRPGHSHPQTVTQTLPLPVPSSQAIRPAATPVIATFFLSEGTTRAPSNAPILRLPPNTSEVKLQIELRGQEQRGGIWTVEVLRGSRSVWLAGNVLPQTTGRETFLAIQLPATSLPDGSYSVHLTQSSDGSASMGTTDVPSRAFNVRRQ